MDHGVTMPEREAHMREMLKDRLAALDAQAPALDALYQSLSPEQKTELDHMGPPHGMRDGMHGGMMHGWHHDGGPQTPPDSQG
jgi:hypothetical protein